MGPRLGNKVVELRNVTKSFGDRTLISDLTLSVPPGSIVGEPLAACNTFWLYLRVEGFKYDGNGFLQGLLEATVLASPHSSKCSWARRSPTLAR